MASTNYVDQQVNSGMIDLAKQILECGANLNLQDIHKKYVFVIYIHVNQFV